MYIQTNSRTLQKCNKSYNGQIFLPTKTDAYVNLSDRELTLQLGLKCHFKSKFDPIVKKLETEMLNDSLLKL